MSETELSVVCKSCGAEVSPYVTECPYCGARVRKRAPELERRDGVFEPKRSRREKRRRRRQEARLKGERRGLSGRMTLASHLPRATLILILVPAIAMVARIATGSTLGDFGAVTIPFGDEWWRFLTAPFAYQSIGYLFVVGLGLAIFGPGLERRLGLAPTLLLLIACGALGALAAFGIETERGGLAVIAGGNGVALGAIAAWFFTARAEARIHDESIDVIGVIICAAVILLLPLVLDGASPWAGVAGALVGGIAGQVAVIAKR